MRNKRAQMKPLTVRDLRLMSPKEKRKAIRLEDGGTETVDIKKPAAKKTSEKKPTVKKSSEKKPTTRKTAAKKTAADKTVTREAKRNTSVKTVEAGMDVTMVLQYQGSDIDVAEITNRVKATFTKGRGRKKIVNTLDVYIKTEERRAYYVINGKSDGSYIEF